MNKRQVNKPDKPMCKTQVLHIGFYVKQTGVQRGINLFSTLNPQVKGAAIRGTSRRGLAGLGGASQYSVRVPLPNFSPRPASIVPKAGAKDKRAADFVLALRAAQRYNMEMRDFARRVPLYVRKE